MQNFTTFRKTFAISTYKSVRPLRVASLLGISITAVMFGLQDPPDYIAEEPADANIDGTLDTLMGSPAVGELYVTSGVDGELIVTFTGSMTGSLFGYSVAVFDDLNGDGEQDIVIGAPADESTPGADDQAGKVYVFYGPFDANEPLYLTELDASMVLASPVVSNNSFGEAVGEVSDVTGDGLAEIRVLEWEPDGLGGEVQKTYVFFGTTGAPRYAITGIDPFDPWMSYGFLGDADGDADVDLDDIDVVFFNFDAVGVDLTSFDGDFNGDQVVDELDLEIATNNLGFNGFDFIWNFDIPGDGGHWDYDCDGDLIWIPDNTDIICDGGGGGGGGTDWPPWWPDPPDGAPRPPFTPPTDPPGWCYYDCPDGSPPPPRDPPPSCGVKYIELAWCQGGLRYTEEPVGSGNWVERSYERMYRPSDHVWQGVMLHNGGDVPQWEYEWSIPVGLENIEIHPDYLPLDQWHGSYLAYKTLNPGSTTIRVEYDYGTCRGSDEWAFTILDSPDLDIDSSNTQGFGPPSRLDDAIENAPIEERYGKIIFADTTDSDADGIPDFADGYDLFTDDPRDDQSAGQFYPAIIELDLPTDPGIVTVAFQFSDADPADVSRSQDWNDYQLTTSGIFRLWLNDADVARDMRSILDGGDLLVQDDYDARPKKIPWNSFFDGGQIDSTQTIYLEGVRSDMLQIRREIGLRMYIDNLYVMYNYTNRGSHGGEDNVVVDSFELTIQDTHDAAQYDETNGTASLDNTAMESIDNDVSGAITDGVSVCYLEMEPAPDPNLIPPIEIGIVKQSDPTVNIPKVVGTFASARESDVNGNWTLPLLPTPWNDVANDYSPSVADFSTGEMLYVPPETYADPNFVNGTQKLDTGEMTYMQFRVMINGENSGEQSFILRRPPLVLVHGIMSDPSTWDSVLWNENPANSLDTRLYFVDWSATGSLGYAENYFHVAKKIEDALEDYRTANDNGHNPNRGFKGRRYAATRADAIGHSQGGQLIRWYISDGIGQPPAYRIERSGWLTICGMTAVKLTQMGNGLT